MCSNLHFSTLARKALLCLGDLNFPMLRPSQSHPTEFKAQTWHLLSRLLADLGIRLPLISPGLTWVPQETSCVAPRRARALFDSLSPHLPSQRWILFVQGRSVGTRLATAPRPTATMAGGRQSTPRQLPPGREMPSQE